MSLLKWKEFAQRKTDLGQSINLVRETLKEKKIADELGQVGYEKMFRPITSGLSKMAPKYKDAFVYEQRAPGYRTLLDYPPDQDPGDERDVLNVGIADDDDDENYEIFDGVDLIQQIPEGEFSKETGYDVKDVEDARRDSWDDFSRPLEEELDEIMEKIEDTGMPSQREKQIPTPPPSYSEAASYTTPPKYTEAQYFKKKEQEAQEEKRVIEELGLPLSSEISAESIKEYDEMVKKLGYSAREMRKNLSKTTDPDKLMEISKQIKKMENQSRIVTKVRNSMKKTGRGFHPRLGGLNPLLKKLEVIIGEIQAGNNSREMKKMGRAILEVLVGTPRK